MGDGERTAAARAAGGPPGVHYPWRTLDRGRARLADPRIRYVLGVLALAVAYRGVAQIGYEVQFAGPVAAIVWLPVGVGIAFLYLGGLRFWPGVVLGDLLANDYTALPLGSALGQTCGNLLEVVVATLLLRQLTPSGQLLGSIAGLGRMLLAIAAGTAVSATIGTLSLWLGGVVMDDAVLDAWRTWWLGDASGALIVLPLAVAWYRPPPPELWRRRWLEGALVLVAVASLSAIAFRSDSPLTYIVFPALIWAALRFRQHGATLSVAVAAGFAIAETTRQVGPFVFDSATDSVLSTQLYIAVAALSTLCLAAVVSEREAFADRLAASRARLVEAGDVERRRIEHNLHDGAQQRLTALVVHLRIAAEQAREAPDGGASLLQDAEVELSGAIDELRELAHGIHPSILTEQGLAAAIKAVAARSTLPIELLELPAEPMDGTAEATAYFVFAEAVTNARKHAQATSICVRAGVRRGILHVEVVDDGVGGARESAGAGLQGLRDRVEAIGGTFEVRSATGGGTAVAARIPVTA